MVVAANRDEFHDRPTEGPTLRNASQSRRRMVAPRDLRAGGTWLGVNDVGVFAAVTNRRCQRPDPARRSRGGLVVEALGCETAAEAADWLEHTAPRSLNPFNLLVADAETAHLISYDEHPERRELEPGLHVVGNLHPDESSAKLERLRRDAKPLTEPGAADPESLGGLCRDHAGGPLEATCVHAGSYGTGSSTLLRLGQQPFFHFADGPPCRAPYRDSTSLLLALTEVPGSGAMQARG